MSYDNDLATEPEAYPEEFGTCLWCKLPDAPIHDKFCSVKCEREYTLDEHHSMRDWREECSSPSSTD